MSKDERPAAQVSYSLGFTRNMGNFESLRVDLGVTDVAWEGELVADAKARIKHFVESQLLDDVEEIERDILNLRKKLREEDADYKRKVQSAAKTEEEADK